MRRREFMVAAVAVTAALIDACRRSIAGPNSRPVVLMAQLSPPIEQSPTLLTAPIELAGDWGHMPPRAANQVIERIRHACLDGIRLLSDCHQTILRVDEHTSGPPAVWLHPDDSSMAWMMLASELGRNLLISSATSSAT
jgi:hypothetical protein